MDRLTKAMDKYLSDAISNINNKGYDYTRDLRSIEGC